PGSPAAPTRSASRSSSSAPAPTTGSGSRPCRRTHLPGRRSAEVGGSRTRRSARRVEPGDVAQERGVEVLALDHLGHLLGGGEPLVVDPDHRDDLGDARHELLVAGVQRTQVAELDLRLDVALALRYA